VNRSVIFIKVGSLSRVAMRERNFAQAWRLRLGVHG